MRSQKNTIELYLHSALGVKIKFNSLKRSIFYLIEAEILEQGPRLKIVDSDNKGNGLSIA